MDAIGGARAGLQLCDEYFPKVEGPLIEHGKAEAWSGVTMPAPREDGSADRDATKIQEGSPGGVISQD